MLYKIDPGDPGISMPATASTRPTDSAVQRPPYSEYQERADWIVRLLLHHYWQQSDGSCFWLPDHTAYATADLLTGNAGVIHFLLRHYRPDLFTHPLLPV
jgi:hypothetical protein